MSAEEVEAAVSRGKAGLAQVQPRTLRSLLAAGSGGTAESCRLCLEAARVAHVQVGQGLWALPVPALLAAQQLEVWRRRDTANGCLRRQRRYRSLAQGSQLCEVKAASCAVVQAFAAVYLADSDTDSSGIDSAPISQGGLIASGLRPEPERSKPGGAGASAARRRQRCLHKLLLQQQQQLAGAAAAAAARHPGLPVAMLADVLAAFALGASAAGLQASAPAA